MWSELTIRERDESVRQRETGWVTLRLNLINKFEAECPSADHIIKIHFEASISRNELSRRELHSPKRINKSMRSPCSPTDFHKNLLRRWSERLSKEIHVFVCYLKNLRRFNITLRWWIFRSRVSWGRGLCSALHHRERGKLFLHLFDRELMKLLLATWKSFSRVRFGSAGR